MLRRARGETDDHPPVHYVRVVKEQRARVLSASRFVVLAPAFEVGALCPGAAGFFRN